MRLGLWIVTAAVSLGLVGGARAAVDADHPAAIVLFPRLAVDSSIGVDTLVRLSNTSTDPLTIHCFLVDATPVCQNNPAQTCLRDSLLPQCVGPCITTTWTEVDFSVTITENQPIGWLVSQGLRDCQSNPSTDPNRPCLKLENSTFIGPNNQSNAGSIPPAPHDQFVGYLQCVAVDATDAPVEQNTLKGEATIIRSQQGGGLSTVCSAGKLGAVCAANPDCSLNTGPCVQGVCSNSVVGAECNTNNDCGTISGICGATQPAPAVVDADGYNAVGLQAIAGANNGDSTLCLGGCTPGQGNCSITSSQSCFLNSDCPAHETCVGQCIANPSCPTGPEYDGCANILMLDHLFDGATDPISNLSVVTNLTLVPCSQDYLRQSPPQVTVQFLVFNEFEQRFSTSQPVKCFKEFRLSNIDTTTNIKSIFSAAVNGTLTGQTRIRGVPDDTQQVYGDTLIGMAREYRCGPGSTLANCNVVSTSAFNLHSQGLRPETDLIYLPPTN